MRVINFSDVDLICRAKDQKIVLIKGGVTEIADGITTEEELMASYGSYIKVLPTLTRPEDATDPVDNITVKDAIKKANDIVGDTDESTDDADEGTDDTDEDTTKEEKNTGKGSKSTKSGKAKGSKKQSKK